MSKLRLSWSLINAWKNQRYDDAVRMYLHLPSETTPQMEEGIKWHKRWEKGSQKGKLEIGEVRLNYLSPEPEKEITVNFDEFFDLKCRLDCLDRDQRLFDEYKTGVLSSKEYARGGQPDFYYLITKIAKIPIDKCRLTHFNQYEKRADMTVIWFDEESIENAINYIETIGSDIREYFIKNNIPLDKN